ncbi:MAG: hypothetical protein HWQ23_06220 [Nostoc sp. JL33]|nr:hypothetical protein [Nostoc sp. JL33]MBN3869898.1 hypothetical protein [Nostoc sp. JL33]
MLLAISKMIRIDLKIKSGDLQKLAFPQLGLFSMKHLKGFEIGYWKTLS